MIQVVTLKPTDKPVTPERPEVGCDILYYVGPNFNGWQASPLANKFRPDEVGGIEKSLDLYKQWLDEVTCTAKGEAYDALSFIGICDLLGTVKLASFFPGRSNAHVIMDKVKWLNL